MPNIKKTKVHKFHVEIIFLVCSVLQSNIQCKFQAPKDVLNEKKMNENYFVYFRISVKNNLPHLSCFFSCQHINCQSLYPPLGPQPSAYPC